ncbi:MAG: hypothetical protein JO205_02100 [Pseudolabrys sp.]|nr:hypothetical protein [Pseudolabrys sp.]
MSLRAHAIITASLFGAIIVFAIVGNVLHDAGILKDGAVIQAAAKYLFFALFLGFGYSAIPLMVKFVLAGQVVIGNADVTVVRAAIARERLIVFTLWGLITLGLVIAIPAAVMNGMFSSAPVKKRAVEIPSEGTLVAVPGMAVADVQRRSTLKMAGLAARGRVFDFTVPDTKLTFPRARAYDIAASGDRITRVAVGTSQTPLSRSELEGENVVLREMLSADGWLTGYENTRIEQDKRFHGGLLGGQGGVVWLKGDTILMIRAQRLDDPKDGEGADAGRWQQVVELTAKRSFPDLGKYEFAKPY